MKKIMLLAVLGLGMLSFSGCLSPDGDTVAAKRDAMKVMRDDALEEFYTKNPGLKEKVAKSAGYAVFKDFGVDIFVPSTESGWGMVHNNKTGEITYMKMFSLGFGIGMGVRDFRALFVFQDQGNIANFINSGWGLGVQANAVFRFGDVGDGIGGGAEVAPGIMLYKITRNGIALHATIQGTKIWGNENMNAK